MVSSCVLRVSRGLASLDSIIPEIFANWYKAWHSKHYICSLEHNDLALIL
jgi:hypothetical protein